ncbi:MAG: hypothetical protein ABEK17_00410 [Candidatus Aenigmatarchaeota archaeon]
MSLRNIFKDYRMGMMFLLILILVFLSIYESLFGLLGLYISTVFSGFILYDLFLHEFKKYEGIFIGTFLSFVIMGLEILYLEIYFNIPFNIGFLVSISTFYLLYILKNNIPNPFS